MNHRSCTCSCRRSYLCLVSAQLILARGLVQALTAPHVVAEAAAAVEPGPVSLAGHVTLPGPVQAHTWTALGKMCLADKALAKKCLPLFVQVNNTAGRARSIGPSHRAVYPLNHLLIQTSSCQIITRLRNLSLAVVLNQCPKLKTLIFSCIAFVRICSG